MSIEHLLTVPIKRRLPVLFECRHRVGRGQLTQCRLSSLGVGDLFLNRATPWNDPLKKDRPIGIERI